MGLVVLTGQFNSSTSLQICKPFLFASDGKFIYVSNGLLSMIPYCNSTRLIISIACRLLLDEIFMYAMLGIFVKDKYCMLVLMIVIDAI